MKPFKEMNKENILLFLDNFRKPEDSPFTQWIGTCNVYTVLLVKFFKTLHLLKYSYLPWIVATH